MQHQANIILEVGYFCGFPAFSFNFCHRFCIICVEMSMKNLTNFFFKFLLSVSVSTSFFSPSVLMFGSVTQLLQRTQNHQPASKMVTAIPWRTCSLPWQLYEGQFEDPQSHMKNSVYMFFPQT